MTKPQVCGGWRELCLTWDTWACGRMGMGGVEALIHGTCKSRVRRALSLCSEFLKWEKGQINAYHVKNVIISIFEGRDLHAIKQRLDYSVDRHRSMRRSWPCGGHDGLSLAQTCLSAERVAWRGKSHRWSQLGCSMRGSSGCIGVGAAGRDGGQMVGVERGWEDLMRAGPRAVSTTALQIPQRRWLWLGPRHPWLRRTERDAI